MAVRIELDERALGKVSAAVRRAAEGAMRDLHADVVMAQVVPFDNGIMQNGGTYSSGVTVEGMNVVDLTAGSDIHLALCFDAPQARRLYYHPEYHFQKKNQNAGGLWLEPWISGSKKDFLLNAYAELLRREL